MDQFNKMAYEIAELQSALEVYRGFFEVKEEHDLFFSKFPEIGASLKKALSIKLIIGCAALLTDPHETKGDENMSLKNIYEKYKREFSPKTAELWANIETKTANMNLKKFRNKLVGHFSLDEKLGRKAVSAAITNQDIEELLLLSNQFLHSVIQDANSLKSGNILAYYTPIPARRSPKRLLEMLRYA